MSAHTLGPWEFDLVTLEVSALVDPDNSPNYYAPVCQLDDEWTPEIVAAHGRLIFSAPDLLAICLELDQWERDPDKYGGDLAELAIKARAAIRKATGESA